MWKAILCFGFLTTCSTLKCAAQLSFRQSSEKTPVSLKINVLPQNFYNQHKGVVCKIEDRLQMRTGLPLYVRLGDKAYVDYLEQKPNATRPRN